jgi:ribosome maturation factor RimP
MRTDPQVLWQLAEPLIQGAGLELIELKWNREGEGWVLRVFIDKPEPPHLPGGHEPPQDVLPQLRVSHEDCESASRDLSAALDVADAIHHTYRLEVSSPGIDRPLRRERDFRRFVGQQAKIRLTEPVDGRRNFSGVLRGAQGGQAEIECDGKSYQLPIATISRANLIPDWAAEFRRRGEAPEPPASNGAGPHTPHRSAP